MPAKIRGTIVTQLIATAGALLLMNQTGFADGWTSPNMARLTEGNATLSLTLTEASWVVSSFQLGRFMAVILIPMFIELAGSRKTILYSFVPAVLSWVMTMVAKSATWLYVARFSSGITDGLAFGCYSIFLGEVSTPELRGTFTSIAMVGWPLGSLVATVAETYLPMRMSSAIYLVPCLLGILLFTWLPESPYQLVKTQRMSEAAKSLVWYRGHEDTYMEMKEIVDFVQSTNKVTVAERIQQLKSPSIRKAFILVSALSAFPEFCGVFNVIFYMQIILTSSKSYIIEPSEVVIYANAIQLIVNVAGVKLMDRLGRRILLVMSSIGITVALIGLGLHYYLLNNYRVDSQALPITSIILFLTAFTIGFASVPSTLVGEMFPIGIKSTVATTASFASGSIGFVATKAYQPLIDAIGETCVFWMYAAFMASAVPIVLFFLPETKGKSFQEIQEIQNGLNKK